jgi:hypothetical protein
MDPRWLVPDPPSEEDLERQLMTGVKEIGLEGAEVTIRTGDPVAQIIDAADAHESTSSSWVRTTRACCTDSASRLSPHVSFARRTGRDGHQWRPTGR